MEVTRAVMQDHRLTQRRCPTCPALAQMTCAHRCIPRAQPWGRGGSHQEDPHREDLCRGDCLAGAVGACMSAREIHCSEVRLGVFTQKEALACSRASRVALDMARTLGFPRAACLLVHTGTPSCRLECRYGNAISKCLLLSIEGNSEKYGEETGFPEPRSCCCQGFRPEDFQRTGRGRFGRGGQPDVHPDIMPPGRGFNPDIM